MVVYCPDNFHEERKYIFKTILTDMMGIEYTVEFDRSISDSVVLKNGTSLLTIKDVFFQQEKQYLCKDSLPHLPLPQFDSEKHGLAHLFINKKVPVIYGKKLVNDDFLLCESENSVLLGIDIFGSAFFCLTRYEEYVDGSLDQHGRFPAKSSIAFREAYLCRPIINEYIELLWWSIKSLCPHLRRKKRTFRVIPTHDVDRPFGTAFLSEYQKLHMLIGDIVKRRNFKLFFRNLKNIIKIYRYGYNADDDNTFARIMDISERYNLKSIFFFMTAAGLSTYDGNYDIRRKEIVSLMKEIINRGHRIGIHPSYESYRNREIIADNVALLRCVMRESGLSEDIIEGRQHWLRWKAPDTWRYYCDAGIKCDMTLSFADHIGFRCGICYEYRTFDIIKRKSLDLIEYPLIVMDCSGLAEKYMNLTGDDMVSKCISLKNACRKYNGNFVILWHNTYFVDKENDRIYSDIIKG